jgi:hypothetical protein
MKEYSIKDLFKMAWEECNPREMIVLIEISGQLLVHAPESKEYGLLVINALKILRKKKAILTKILNIDSDQAVQIAVDCFNDINFFKRNEDGNFVDPWMFFPVGGFKVNNVSFQRPERSGQLPMYDRIFDQLVYADTAFSAFCVLLAEHKRLLKMELKDDAKLIEKEIEEIINSMIAVLYTPAEKFEAHRIEVLARLVPLELDMSQRMLILHTYANVRTFIVSRCKHLFPKPTENKDQQKEIEPVLTGPMWQNLRYDLAETEVFKGFNVARNANIYDAIDYLDKKAKENATPGTH